MKEFESTVRPSGSTTCIPTSFAPEVEHEIGFLTPLMNKVDDVAKLMVVV